MAPPVLDIAIVGAPRCGKSSIIRAFDEPSFNRPIERNALRTWYVSNVLFKCQLYELRVFEPNSAQDDLSASDLYKWASRVIARTHVNTKSFMLVYDASKPVTFLYIQFFRSVLLEIARTNSFELFIFIVGNKADLLPPSARTSSDKVVPKFHSHDGVLRSIKSYGNKFTKHDQILTSARCNWKITALFEKAVTQAVVLTNASNVPRTLSEVRVRLQRGIFRTSSARNSKYSQDSTTNCNEQADTKEKRMKKYSEPIVTRKYAQHMLSYSPETRHLKTSVSSATEMRRKLSSNL